MSESNIDVIPVLPRISRTRTKNRSNATNCHVEQNKVNNDIYNNRHRSTKSDVRNKEEPPQDDVYIDVHDEEQEIPPIVKKTIKLWAKENYRLLSVVIIVIVLIIGAAVMYYKKKKKLQNENEEIDDLELGESSYTEEPIHQDIVKPVRKPLFRNPMNKFRNKNKTNDDKLKNMKDVNREQQVNKYKQMSEQRSNQNTLRPNIARQQQVKNPGSNQNHPLPQQPDTLRRSKHELQKELQNIKLKSVDENKSDKSGEKSIPIAQPVEVQKNIPKVEVQPTKKTDDTPEQKEENVSESDDEVLVDNFYKKLEADVEAEEE